jgi:hypothetical protein
MSEVWVTPCGGPQGTLGNKAVVIIHRSEHIGQGRIVQGTYDLRKNYGEGTQGAFNVQNLMEFKLRLIDICKFFFFMQNV